MSAWKILLAAALVVPPGAYVAGALSSADTPETTRTPLRLPATSVADPDGMPTEPATVLDPLPARPPSRTPAPTPAPAPAPRDCDDEDDTDDLDVIRPCPETVDGDDDDDDDLDDDSDDRDDSDDGPDGDD